MVNSPGSAAWRSLPTALVRRAHPAIHVAQLQHQLRTRLLDQAVGVVGRDERALGLPPAFVPGVPCGAAGAVLQAVPAPLTGSRRRGRQGGRRHSSDGRDASPAVRSHGCTPSRARRDGARGRLPESARLPVEQVAGMCNRGGKLFERLFDGNSGRLRAFRALGDAFTRGVDVDARDAPRAAQQRRGYRAGARKRVEVEPEGFVGRGSLDDLVKDIRGRGLPARCGAARSFR